MSKFFEKKQTKYREEAEKLFSGKQVNPDKLSREEMIKIIEELEVYQIELKLQNDELINTQVILEEKNNEVETLFEEAPVGYLVINKNFEVIKANKTFAEMMSISKLKLVSTEILRFIAPKYITDFVELIENIDFNQVKSMELEFLSNSGDSFFAEIGVKIEGSPNKDNRYFITIANITEIKILANKYSIANERLKAVINTIPDLIFFKDYNFVYQGCNIAFENYSGLKENELKGLTDFDIFDEKQAQFFRDMDVRMFENGKSRVNEEWINYPDGEKALLETIKTPIYDDKNKILGMVGISRDITERYKIEQKQQEYLEELRVLNESNIEQLHKMNKMNLQLSISKKELKELNDTKDKFFSIIAHDLKNPFNALRHSAEMLYSNFEYLDDNNKKEQILGINESAEFIYKLLENLLNWSRSQTGRIKFEPQEYDIYELVVNNIYMMNNFAKEKEIVIKSEVKINTIAQMDYNMINTILRNLINNAIKFTSKGGRINIKVEDMKDSLALQVEDNGIGMSEEKIEKLFKINENISTRGTNNERGTGLGLIIVKEFVEYHNGIISVESKIGKGTTFKIDLPKVIN